MTQAALQSDIKTLSPQQSPSEEVVDDVAQSGAMSDPANATGRAPKSTATMSSDAMTLERSSIRLVDLSALDLILTEIMMNYPSSMAAILHYLPVRQLNQYETSNPVFVFVVDRNSRFCRQFAAEGRLDPAFAGRRAGGRALRNDTRQPAELVGASSPAYGEVMIHMSTEEQGRSTMVHLEKVEVPPGGEVIFRPGSYHLMLIKPSRALR